MFQTKTNDAYTAFGYSIQSVIPFPELRKTSSLSDTPDISIRYGDLTHKQTELMKSPKKISVGKDEVVFHIPHQATFSVEKGTTITISPEQDADVDIIRLYVLGTCMGAILFQRKILPLHGSAVVIDGKAYAFVGHSGHGKSTLASAFLQQGYRLITDDVIALTLDDCNNPFVTPSYPQQKLWQESLDAFGMNSKLYRPLFDRETKFAVPVHSYFSENAVPLAGVFELVKMDCQHAEIRAVTKNLERLSLLYRHTYRNYILSEGGLTAWHFETTTRLSANVSFYQLRRPVHEQTVNQLADIVLDAIKDSCE